ncbi:MAG TPA: glutamate--tRNA ligase [Acidobacteriota bacterium]|nr:glutamate--tRNA ligase [Acidobacteriota bacterium]
MSKPVRVRIAPSPSGHLHVGTARTAVYNWLFARHHGGVLILRIEDTDRERSHDEYVDSIQESLRWLGLDWDEGPHFQSQRGAVYDDWVERLRGCASAYPCYCTPEELAAAREEAMAAKQPVRYPGTCRNLTDAERRAKEEAGHRPALRLRIGPEMVQFNDLVYGEQSRSGEDLDDFICVRADGRPTYNFACVIDDSAMQISHVIRGNDHITNTFKQVLLYRALDVAPPEFAHLPLNLGKDRRKISKREGATSVIEFGEQGYLPEAIVNFLALLGWSPGDDREIMTREEMIAAFSLDRVNAANPIFDLDKLAWMNGEYIRALPVDGLLDRTAPLFMAAGFATAEDVAARRDWYRAVVATLQERMKLLNDAVELSRFYFEEPTTYDPKGARKQFTRPGADGDLMLLAAAFADIDDTEFTKDRAEAALRGLAEEFGRKPAELIHPLRLALTGTTAGPGLFDIVTLLGKENCRVRIERAVQYIRSGDIPTADGESVKS